jgi:ABC-type dipeptide/oligopeptide/nickel transport system permease component
MTLFFGILFGAIGGVYLALARREHEVDYLICGVALILYPYFFSSVVLIVIIGVVIAVIPIARRRGWI